MAGVPSGNARSVEAIQATLEEMDVEFIGAPESQAGVRWGITVWLVSLMDYDLGYFDLESNKVQALDNPFGPKVLGV